MEKIMPRTNSTAAIAAAHITYLWKYIMKTKIHTRLNNGFFCPLPLLNSIKQEMEFIAPVVPQDALLTVKQLSAEDYYATLSDWEKTLAGSCMIHLVEHGLVPFEYVPRKGRNPYPLQFRIKGSYTPNR
jgi:hypothetical protein